MGLCWMMDDGSNPTRKVHLNTNRMFHRLVGNQNLTGLNNGARMSTGFILMHSDNKAKASRRFHSTTSQNSKSTLFINITSSSSSSSSRDINNNNSNKGQDNRGLHTTSNKGSDQERKEEAGGGGGAGAVRPLALNSGAAMIPHPAKAAKGGEDAFFVDDM
eukprot:TRINITY_DN3071_c0_g1_i1.p1 TRINITY_DN3071_c0_g1~~TRINITY_DN3071_c0_g1_i1.p1  ORF type:complete len:161 (+),score=47.07 TRINITY_DN3071_c0_g1_i1:3-485(+)